MNKIVWLHVHDSYSIRDGVGDNLKFVKKAKEMNQPALALTNHGNMSGSLNHYLNCKEEGIKAIWGQEFYIVNDMNRKGFTDKEKEEITKGYKKAEGLKVLKEKEKESDFRKSWHITILAKNKKGYKNLIKLSSIGWLKGFYYRPRIDYKTLFKYKEGLIVLSGCTSSKLAYLTQKHWKHGVGYAAEMAQQFGKDFYLEIMLINYEPQIKLNNACYYLGKKLNIPVVLTNDIHYVKQEHSKIQDMFRKTMSKEEWGTECNDLHFKTIKELKTIWKKMYSELPWWFYKKAIKNTLKINSKIKNIKIPTGKFILPKIGKSKEENEKYFRKMIKKGWKKYLGHLNKKPELRKKYKKRLKKEYAVIKNNGFVDIFLIVLDLVNYMRNDLKRLCYARGSVAGSLIAYLLDITLPDPVRHDLLFERFLNQSRVKSAKTVGGSLPDIDVDIPDRDLAINYLKKKYGEDKCCTIGSFDRIKIKSGIKMFGKVESDSGKKGWDFNELNAITTPIPDVDNLKEIIGNDKYKFKYWYPKFKRWYKEHKDWYKDYVKPVVDCPAWNSKHPAGLIVTPIPITKISPLKLQSFKDESEKKQGVERTVVTQYEDQFLEKRGLFKLDVLGLRTIKIFEEMINMIEEKYGKKIDLKELSNKHLDDEKVMKAFRKQDAIGIMQLDGYKGMQGLASMKPKKFSDLVALNALLRPGTSQVGTDRLYFDRMNGHARVKYDHPLFEKVLKKTYGIMVYQEQVTKIVHLLGGLSLAESDKVRDAIKKKNKDKLLKFKNVFIKGALKRGCKNKKEANRIFDLINSFSSYSFNKSHSCAYIIYSYMQMWFKVYYPIVFYYALLKYPKKDRRKKEEILKEIKDDIIRHDIPLKMPDVNISKAHPIIKKDSIVWGLTDIKYVGESYVNDIIKGQPYKSIEDYIERSGKGKNKRVIESLLKAGAFDRFEMSRKEQCREIFNVLDKDISKDFKDYKKDKFWIEKSEEVLGFVNYKRR